MNTPQGLAALMAYDASAKIGESVEKMTAAIQAVREATITRAVRDSKVDGILVKEGAYLGVIGGKVKLHGDDLEGVVVETVQQIVDDACEVVSLYYGQDIDCAAAQQFVTILEKAFPDLAIEIYAGGQPHYHFVISAE